jgi:hypothetical protein
VKRHNGHLINFVNQEIILSKKKQHRNNIFVYCNYNKTVKKSWRETKGVIRSRKSKDRQYNGQKIKDEVLGAFLLGIQEIYI